MKSRWDDEAAARAVRERGAGVSEELALRTYSARLLGADAALVLHGGGNTSVKAEATTALGESVSVLHVKGSGWDLATIEPPGHPAVRMEPLMKLLARESMTDEQMVNELRLALLDAGAPTPSVETLLHAALPAKFIDHTHADALLAIVDQDDARARCDVLFGDKLLFIPYVMPGFGLARACKVAWDAAVKEGRAPTVMVLERHGIFTFGDTAKESYERMIEAVTRCEERAPLLPVTSTSTSTSESKSENESDGALTEAELARCVVAVRGALAAAAKDEPERGPIVALRSSPAILAFLDRPDAHALTQRGCATPDHVIRTKPWPLHLRGPADDPEAAIAAYAARYDAYFDDVTKRRGLSRKKLDPWPRIVLVPKVGILGVGKTKKDAEIAADVYEHTLDVIARAENVGAYAPVGLDDLFDVEYWSLEQAKLKPSADLPLARTVALVTGAASGIGRATAACFVELGAHVVLCDRDEGALADAVKSIGKKAQTAAVRCDVTSESDVAHAFAVAALTFGGVDCVVSNAGMAAEGRLDTKEGEGALRASLDVNLLAHVHVARAAAETMKLQRRGGSVSFNASKSAFNQGPGFGPYAVAKAALVSLMRQYAVDLAGSGIRSNAVNADRIRTNIFLQAEPGAPPLVELRAKARGITVDEYFRSNLLQREVLARDVAEAFAYLARARATTGCVVTVDGGNAAAFPR
ncbi:MAG: bifunctional aldolase/short-chain dehydrogenase [Labilithrix sp.]|nr:bifunctional aldolase/short-chain dehydrogenase [Labilithrix sp.]MCW5811666.1 bifunctional aldolase/short-chain dehydrogenase [Labilithrix sp.]